MAFEYVAGEFDEEVEALQPSSCHEHLFDFLYKIRQHHRQPELEGMFSPPVELGQILRSAHDYVEESHRQFQGIVGQGSLVINAGTFVHNDILISNVEAGQRKNFKRALATVPHDKKHEAYQCTIHSKECSLTEDHHAFICFLNCTPSAELSPEPDAAAPAEVDLETEVDVEVDIDSARERQLVEQMNVEAQRDFGVYVPEEEVVQLEEGKEVVPVPTLPTFPFGHKEYVLVSDLQNVFNLREDYCLAIIAQSLEESDFIDNESEKYNTLETAVKDTEYLDAAKTLSMIYDDAKRYEETLPTEAEFQDVQQRLGISEMGKDSSGGSSAVSRSGIDLWNRRTLVDDENQKVRGVKFEGDSVFDYKLCM